jgi:glycosyltransferase involved in cell wall biosynthesis
MRRLFAHERPDLVQTFLFHANIIGRLAARLAGVPHVICAIRVAEWQSRWHLWVDRLTSDLVDRYVCVSRSVARFSQVRGGLPRGKLTVIPNGIDLQRYPAQRPADLTRWGIAPGRKVVTFVGRLDRQKGVDWLLQTAPSWLSRLPDCDLLLVGTGPEESDLRQATAEMGIDRRVHFSGWQPDVPAILAASHLLVLPSRWEGMPNVVLQAMATGLPVLATDVEGTGELLGDAADAQTARFGRSHEFADQLIGLMADPARSAELGAKNRRRAEAHFAVERMVAAYQDLWRSLASAKPDRGR